jgi:putative oxidoreductase
VSGDATIAWRTKKWGDSMDGQTKLIFPGLEGFYKSIGPFAYTLVRVVVGTMFVMHVLGKFKVGAAAVAANAMAKNGLEPALAFAYAALFLESVGGVCIIIGLFTRFFAAALAIEMLIALFAVHWAKGYAAGGGGYEYVLLIGAVMFAIAIRGGGPYSADRAIGKEL